ncbi:hypothetical protein [Azospirillum argentinense]|uniref:hypothetical protein n=1 Tax=Azospirillum argentinense TaxID=2970906 RepID=UPI0032DEDB13
MAAIVRMSEFPAASAAEPADALLAVRGAGNVRLTVAQLLALAGAAPPGLVSVLGCRHTPVDKSDTTVAETALYTLVIPGNTLGPNDSLRVSFRATYPNSAVTKTMRLRLGGTLFYARTESTQAAYAGQVLISNRNALNSQIGGFNNAGNVLGSSGSNHLTGAVDLAAEQALTFTMAWGTAGSGSSLFTLESILVEHLRAPA